MRPAARLGIMCSPGHREPPPALWHSWGNAPRRISLRCWQFGPVERAQVLSEKKSSAHFPWTDCLFLTASPCGEQGSKGLGRPDTQPARGGTSSVAATETGQLRRRYPNDWGGLDFLADLQGLLAE